LSLVTKYEVSQLSTFQLNTIKTKTKKRFLTNHDAKQLNAGKLIASESPFVLVLPVTERDCGANHQG